MASGGIAHFAGEGSSLVGPTGESMLEYLSNNPEIAPEIAPETSTNKPLTKEAQAAKDLLQKNASKASQMGSRTPTNLATAAEGDTLAMQGLKGLGGNVVRPILSGPGAFVGAGGYAASHLAANALSNATDEELQMLQGDIGSDTSMAASALLAGRKNPTVAPAAVPAKPVAPVQPAPAAPAAAPSAAPATPASPLSISDPSQVGPQYSLSKPSSVAPTDNAGIASAPAVTSPTSDPFIASLMNKISEREAESKKNAETNKYLALLQGAFKTMGGKSQYALENIGAGGESAVGTYAALNQATQKEQADLMNQQLGLYKYQSAADIGRKRNELAERALGEKPTLIENLQVKADTALNRNPQYISLSKGLEKEREAGTLTPEKEQRYLSNMEMITKNTYSNFGVPYKSSTVKLPPIETPAAPKPKGFFENMFSSSTPEPTPGWGPVTVKQQ